MKKTVLKSALALFLSLLLIAGILPLSAAAEAVEVAAAKQKVKEVVYYDKNPDPSAEGEMKDFPAVWMAYEDDSGHDNFEVFVLKAVNTEEEAENASFGMKGMRVNGKWFKVAALWTVNPDADIIDKGEGHKALFTPLYYSDADKPNEGDTVYVALYDYTDNALTDPVSIVIPGEGETVSVEVKECDHPDDKKVLEYDESYPNYHSVKCGVCGAELGVYPHDPELKYNSENHWYECKCGWKSDPEKHDFFLTSDENMLLISKCECGCVKQDKYELDDASFPEIPDQLYTGEEIKPEFDVKYELKDGSGAVSEITVPKNAYTVEYKNNVGPGTAEIVISGVEEKSTGSKTIKFNIVEECTHPDDKKVLEYDESYPNYHSVKCGVCGAELGVYPHDPELKYNSENHWYECKCGWKSEPEEHDFFLSSDENMLLISKCECGCVKQDTYKLDEAMLSEIPDQLYTGEEIRPDVSVSVILTDGNGAVLKITLPEEAYGIEYKNNIGPGTAEVIIKSVEGKSEGTKTAQFNIYKDSVDCTHEERITNTEVFKTEGSVTVDGKPCKVLLVNTYEVCTQCGDKVFTGCSRVTVPDLTADIGSVQERNAEIIDSGSSIHLDGDASLEEQLFWDGKLLQNEIDYYKRTGSIIIEFTEKFLSEAGGGEHEFMLFCGDDFTVMTVTMDDSKISELKDKSIDSYDEISEDDYEVIIKEVEESGIEIVDYTSESDPGTEPEPINEWIPGDINGDGEVDNKDIVTLFRYASGVNIEVNLIAVDTNGDGEVDNKDIVVLFRFVSGGDVQLSDKPYIPEK